MFKSFLLVVILINLSIDGQDYDWCSLIIRNGIYDGLRMYHHMGSDPDKHRYVMFNHFNYSWDFRVTKSGSPPKFNIEPIESTIERSLTYDIENSYTTWSYIDGKKMLCFCHLLSQPVIPTTF